MSALLTEATAAPPRPRRPTKPSRAARERRLAAKRRTSERKRLRRNRGPGFDEEPVPAAHSLTPAKGGAPGPARRGRRLGDVGRTPQPTSQARRPPTPALALAQPRV